MNFVLELCTYTHCVKLVNLCFPPQKYNNENTPPNTKRDHLEDPCCMVSVIYNYCKLLVSSSSQRSQTSTYRVDRLHSRIDYNFIRWQYSCTIKYYIFFIDKKMQFWFSRFPDHKWREWQTVVFWSTARNWVSNIWVSNHKSQKPYNTGPLWSLFLFGGVFSFIVLSGEKQRLRSFL